MAWPHHQSRGGDDDLGRGVGPSAPGSSCPSVAVSFGNMAPAPSAYYPRSYVNGGAHCRSSSYTLSSGGGGAGESHRENDGSGGGGGVFSHCVEPQPQRPALSNGRSMCEPRGVSPDGLRSNGHQPLMQQSGAAENAYGVATGIENGSGGGGGSGGGSVIGPNGCFVGDPMLTMIGSSPSYSPHLETEQQQQQQPGGGKREQLSHQHHQQGGTSSSGGNLWPPAHGQFPEEWNMLLSSSATPNMAQSSSQQDHVTSSGFSSSAALPTIHNIAEKQPWISPSHFDRQLPPSSQGQQQQQHDQQHGRDVQDTPHQHYANYTGQQQLRQPSNGWSAPRMGLSRPLSPPDTSPSVLYTSAKDTLPSLLGGGGRVPAMPDSAGAAEGTSDADGGGGGRAVNLSNTTGSGYQDGLQMLVAAHNTTDHRPAAPSLPGGTANSSAANAIAAVSSMPMPRESLDMVPLRASGAPHSSPAACAVLEGGGGAMLREDPLSSGRPGVRAAPGTPAGGGRASKAARTTGGLGHGKVTISSDGGGGVKADAAGGGGAAKNRRQAEENLRDVPPEERLRLNRERNRDHSRRSRERKKAYVESLKKQVSELGAYRMLVEEAHDLISAHSKDVNAFFTFASGGFDRLLGMNPEALMGVSFMELVDPSYSQAVLRQVLATIRRGGIRQVQYRMRPPAGAHAAEVETSFRLVSTRLVAVTRVRGRSPSPCHSPQPAAILPSLALTNTATAAQVPSPSPLVVQPLPPVAGIRVDGGAGGLSLPAEFSGDW